MLEPLQNYEFRQKARKEMKQNYKLELDQQVARKEVKPQDTWDSYQVDQNLAVHNERTQAFPINYSTTFTADPSYDKAIMKYLQRENLIDKHFNPENYDDEVFKRRNLKSKLV